MTANLAMELYMDIESYYTFMKWTSIICFFIIFPPAALIIILALVMIMAGG